MFSLFNKRRSYIDDVYDDILDHARDEKLYTEFGVGDHPQGRFQMITLHAAPYMMRFAQNRQAKESQKLFNRIFKDIELSFREIGVGDLSVPKKMKRYMQDFNGIMQAHCAANADHIVITQRHLCDAGQSLSPEFQTYIKGLFDQ